MLYWLLKNLFVGPLMMTVFRPWVIGKENIPKSGGVIFAGNHLSFIDSVFLPVVLDRPIYFLAKSDYFRGKGIKGFLTRTFFNGTGMLPIDRSGGKASEASLNTGLAVLARGDQLGIYPEGTRSPDGSVARFKAGSFLLAIEAGLPVVPLAVIGTRRVMPKGRLRTEPADVRLVIHDPIAAPALEAPAIPSIDDARRLADRVHAIVARTVDTLQNDTIADPTCM